MSKDTKQSRAAYQRDWRARNPCKARKIVARSRAKNGPRKRKGERKTNFRHCSSCNTDFPIRGKSSLVGWTIKKKGRVPVFYTCPRCSSEQWDGHPLKEEPHPRIERLSDWLGLIVEEEEHEPRALEILLGKLSPVQLRVIEGRYGLNGGSVLTLDEVGSEFGLSRERIRQIEAKSLRLMRAAIPLMQAFAP